MVSPSTTRVTATTGDPVGTARAVGGLGSTGAGARADDGGMGAGVDDLGLGEESLVVEGVAVVGRAASALLDSPVPLTLAAGSIVFPTKLRPPSPRTTVPSPMATQLHAGRPAREGFAPFPGFVWLRRNSESVVDHRCPFQ